MTPEFSKLIQDRDRFRKKALKSNSDAMWSAYRKLSNQTNEELKKAKSNYFQECINNSKDNTFS